MLRTIFLYPLLCITIVGLLWPKISVALIDLGVVNAQFYIICTGNGLEAIAVSDANGEKIDVDFEQHDCIITNPHIIYYNLNDAYVAPGYTLADYPAPHEINGQETGLFIWNARAPPHRSLT